MSALALGWQLIPGALAAVLSVVLAVFCLRRLSRDPLAWPLALTNILIGLWIFSFLAEEFFHHPFWLWMDRASAAWIVAPGLHVVWRFVGKRNRIGLLSIYAAAILAGIISAAEFGLGDLRVWPHFALGTGALIWSLIALLKHARRVADVRERFRAQILLVAWLIGWTLGAFELSHVVDLGMLATFVVTLALAFFIFEDWVQVKGLSTATIVGWVAVGSIALVSIGLGSILLWRDFAWARAAFLFSAFLVFIAALVGVGDLWFGAIRRMRGMWVVGRMSDQLAHDLQNPIAAIRGAAQYLSSELKDETHLEMVELVEAQTRRLESSVSIYRRLAHDHGEFSFRQADELLSSILLPFGLELSSTISESVRVDAELLQIALENLLSNAQKATKDKGSITAGVELIGDDVAFVIQDSGVGMSPRDLVRSRDSFFTKFEGGTGLGLSLAEGVAALHQGKLEMTSILHKGTTAKLIIKRVDRDGPSA